MADYTQKDFSDVIKSQFDSYVRCINGKLMATLKEPPYGYARVKYILNPKI